MSPEAFTSRPLQDCGTKRLSGINLLRLSILNGGTDRRGHSSGPRSLAAFIRNLTGCRLVDPSGRNVLVSPHPSDSVELRCRRHDMLQATSLRMSYSRRYVAHRLRGTLSGTSMEFMPGEPDTNVRIVAFLPSECYHT